MSYDLGLYYNGKPAEVEIFEEGGTYIQGGNTEAKLNITYNYGWFYQTFLDEKLGIRWLYGKKAKDTIQKLEIVVGILGTKKFDNYWAPTPGNAGYALSILLKWARQHPEAIWNGD